MTSMALIYIIFDIKCKFAAYQTFFTGENVDSKLIIQGFSKREMDKNFTSYSGYTQHYKVVKVLCFLSDLNRGGADPFSGTFVRGPIRTGPRWTEIEGSTFQNPD